MKGRGDEGNKDKEIKENVKRKGDSIVLLEIIIHKFYAFASER